MRERVQVSPGGPAEEVHEHGLVERRDLADRPQAAIVQLRRRDASDAPEPLDRQRVEERELRAGLDAQEPLRLRDRARHLREELRARDADGDREPDLVEHAPLQPRGDLGRRACEPLEPAHVQERLVDREPLDERRRVLEDLEHRLARLRVRRHSGRNDDRMRAESPRLALAHRGLHAVGLRLVARREHDAAPDEHGLPAQLRVVALLDRREERIEVCVQDRRGAHCEHMFA